jgi:hypothetical protein
MKKVLGHRVMECPIQCSSREIEEWTNNTPVVLCDFSVCLSEDRGCHYNKADIVLVALIANAYKTR